MLNELCSELKNWFCTDKVFGEFEISGGDLPLDFLSGGQYFRIVGSKFNDGIYQYPNRSLKDETFDGAIWVLNIPKAVLDIADEIETYKTENKATPFTSESFGGYSYSKATDGNGVAASWETVFAKRLNKWRKI